VSNQLSFISSVYQNLIDFKQIESYNVLSRQTVPNDKPVDEIVLIPCISRALVLSGISVHLCCFLLWNSFVTYKSSVLRPLSSLLHTSVIRHRTPRCCQTNPTCNHYCCWPPTSAETPAIPVRLTSSCRTNWILRNQAKQYRNVCFARETVIS